MSKVIPNKLAYPGLQPDGHLEPWQDVYFQDVGDVVEEQHYHYAFTTRQHAGQAFGAALSAGFDPFGNGFCRSSKGLTRVLIYPFIPRAGCTEILYTALIEASVEGTLRVTCRETGVWVENNVNVGLNTIYDVLTINRSDTLTHLEVSLAGDSGYAQLLSFAFCDEDIAAIP